MNVNDARSGIGRMVRMCSHRYSLIAFFVGGLLLSVMSCSSHRTVGRSSYDRGQEQVVQTDRITQPSRDRTQVTPPEEHLDKRSWKPSTLRPHTSRITVGDDASLPLEGTQVHVRIDGFRARVLIDHFFMNNRSRRLEGTFQVRLPNEARPFFLGFGQSGIRKDYLPDHLSSKSKTDRRAGPRRLTTDEILKRRSSGWRNVKVARMVPREKAARAYKQTVREQVDPALMEWSGTGVFRARVFPLFANQMHRIVIGYDVNLRQTGEGALYRHILPEDASNLRVTISVRGHSQEQVQVSPRTAPRPLTDEIRYVFQDPDTKRIRVRINDAFSQLLTGTDPDTGSYFAGRFRADLPERTTRSRSDAVFLIDTSLSSQPDRFQIWLTLLQAILKRNRDRIDRFNILLFDVGNRWWKPGMIPNSPDRVRDALEELNQTVLEGATDLHEALKEGVEGPPNRDPDRPDPELFLLSDGSPSWGARKRRRLTRVIHSRFHGRLYAYQTGLSGTDVRVLDALASETGGAVFSVTSESQIPDAATAHRKRPWTIQNVEMEGGSDVLLAGNPDVIYPGQTLLFAGRGKPTRNGRIKITLTSGDRTRTLTWSPDKTLNSSLTPRFYGQIAVNHLEAGAWSRDNVRPYAMHFRIPGQTASLLMLESKRDYQRFDLEKKSYAPFVKNHPVQSILADRTDRKRNQDEPFFTLLRNLRNTSADGDIPENLLRVLKDRSPSFFTVHPSTLNTTIHREHDLDDWVREALSDGEVSYETVYERVDGLREDNRTDDAVRVLSSLIEQNPGHTKYLRDVGYTLMSWGKPLHAYRLLVRSAMKRPMEPQVYLVCARLLARSGHPLQAMAFFELAHGTDWGERFQQFQQVVAMEYRYFLEQLSNRAVPEALSGLVRKRTRDFRSSPNLRDNDLGVWIVWNTDRTDVDLHVEESTGEECYFENRTTEMGGWLTMDVKEGFGPELYLLNHAEPGSYDIWAEYYASTDDRMGQRTRVLAVVYRTRADGTIKSTYNTVTLDEHGDYAYLERLTVSETHARAHSRKTR